MSRRQALERLRLLPPLHTSLLDASSLPPPPTPEEEDDWGLELDDEEDFDPESTLDEEDEDF